MSGVNIKEDGQSEFCGKPLQCLPQDREVILFVELWQIEKEALIHCSSSHQEMESISSPFASGLACYLLCPIACSRSDQPVLSLGLKGP